ncbi:MAG: MgtC/SapB family protein [Planctomycetota bacterium]
MPPTFVTFEQLGISLLLGLLVGLQRQHTTFGMPGMRTFPLITLFGTVTAILSVEFGGWVFAAGLLGMVAVLAFPIFVRIRMEEPDPGTTTAVAVLLMYGVGALLVALPDQMAVAVAIGGGVAVLLQFKPELHRLVEKLGDEDLRAIMQFVLITCVILPVLPNRVYGPLEVFNPRHTWWMVVLIVGMSLGGYIFYKFFGRNAGILLGGVLGGAISSTATTVSYSRQAQGGAAESRASAIVIMIASTIVFVRVLVEIAVVAPGFLASAAPPVVILMLLTMVPSLVIWYRVRKQPNPMPEQKNPTQLKSAILFAAMYALVLFALAWAKQPWTKEHMGENAMYGVACLSGLTDMDAITLSTARMSQTDEWVAAEGWRLILIAALSNLVFKAVLVGLLGTRRLLGQIALLYAIPLLGGIALVVSWDWILLGYSQHW